MHMQVLNAMFHAGSEHHALCRFRISRFKYEPVPGVDGALVTFRLKPPSHRVQVGTRTHAHTHTCAYTDTHTRRAATSIQCLKCWQARECKPSVPAGKRVSASPQFLLQASECKPSVPVAC